jgi:hypothetical protein
MGFRVKHVHVARRGHLCNVKSFASDELVEIPCSPGKDACMLLAHPRFEKLAVERVKNRTKNTQIDGLIAHCELELANQICGSVAARILFKYHSLDDPCATSPGDDLRLDRR